MREGEELPEGWNTVTLPDVAEIVMGQSPPGISYNDRGLGMPFFQGKAEFGAIHPNPRKWCTDPKKLAQPGDTLISVRAPVGPTNVADSSCAIGRGLAAVRPGASLRSRFLWYALRRVENELAEQGTGSTFSAISRRHLAAVQLALPPVAEQDRIVSRVEDLLAGVSVSAERLANAGACVRRLRRAILAAACCGGLTADWRVDTSLGDDWPTVDLDSVGESFSYGSAAKSSPTGRVPVLRMGNIQNGRLDWTDLVYTSDTKEIAKYRLAAGDVLFNRTNSPELVGKTAVYRGEREAIYAGYLIRVRCSPKLLPDFLNYSLNGPAGKEYLASVRTDGVSQSNINARSLAAFEFGLPSIAEQREIVHRVETLFALADAIEQRVAAASARADKLTQAILAKAFRGELVPTEAELNRRREPSATGR